MMFISMRIDNPAQVLRKEEGCLFAIKPVLWLSHPVRIGYVFLFFFLVLVMGITLLDEL